MGSTALTEGGHIHTDFDDSRENTFDVCQERQYCVEHSKI